MKDIVNLLISKQKTISTMESCTGGFLVNEITNIEGSSKVLFFGAVTYSNEYKIKLGVDENLINKYSVYSLEVAKDMALKISLFSNSDYGIGITGKLKKVDDNNLYGKDDLVFISIYDKENNNYYNESVTVKYDQRALNKKQVIDSVVTTLKDILSERYFNKTK